MTITVFMVLLVFFIVMAVIVLRKIMQIADADLNDYLDAMELSHRLNMSKLYSYKMQLHPVLVRAPNHKGQHND